MMYFNDMEPGVWESMCTPMHEVLAADESKGQGALYIGSWAASAEPELLDRCKIRQIVSVLDSEVKVSPSNGRKAHDIPLADSISADLKRYLKGACQCIDYNLAMGNNVLVHCQQGISRSAAIVIAYLMWKKGMGYDDALAVLRSKRRCVKPNSGFEGTLREWEKELRQQKRTRST